MLKQKYFEQLELLLFQTQKEFLTKWREYSPFNLTLPQAHVLQCLGQENVHQTAEITDLLCVTGEGENSSLCEKLVGDGLVERLHDEKDPAISFLKLSEKGIEVLQSIQQLKREFIEYLLQDMTAQEIMAMEKFITLFLSKMAGE